LTAVSRALNIELLEIPEWNCCGASSAHMTDHLLSIALPANILAKAAKAGMSEVVAPCAACYSRLVIARHEIEASATLKLQVEKVLASPLPELPKVLNILELLAPFAEDIAQKTIKKFDQTVACYYGCLLVRPAKVTKFDQTENPVEMDKLVVAAGGKTIDWNFKTECCGASFSVSKTDIVGRMGAKILGDAIERKAEAIIVACPMCHSNLDLRRGAVNKVLGAKATNIPILFITQVIGMALGIPKKELGLSRHFVPVNFHTPVQAV
jgi:heterodisulfide reductase subunit B